MPANRGTPNTSVPANASPNRKEMIVYIAATAGACLFIVLWATGLNADVAGLIALGILCLGILGHMASRMSARGRERPS
jgi:hypothetical protein